MQPAELRATTSAPGRMEQVVGIAQDDFSPALRTCSGRRPLTVARVPTGMNAGVWTVPCGKVMTPCRARPSGPDSSISKRSMGDL